MPGLVELQTELPAYLVDVKNANSQPAKEIIFARFIERVFDIRPETISMEVPIASKVLLVRGRVDAVFGKILMEFKLDLKRELDDAKAELTKYFQAYYEKHPNESYIGMAHDGIMFRVFQPIFANQLDTGKRVVTSVNEVDSLDLGREQNLERIFLWFDSYLFVSEKTIPTSEDIKRRLGTNSPTFFGVREKFNRFFTIARKYKRNQVKYNNWAKTLEVVYGTSVDEEGLFIKHTYLATLAKLLVHLIVARPKSVSPNDIRSIIYGDIFNRYNISNFIEEDYYTWILDREFRTESLTVLHSLMKELAIYDLEKVDEDFLKSLYEELVDPEVRHDLGEYYTPDWLAQYIVGKALEDKQEASVLDPACGSGTFLFSAVRKKIEYFQSKGKSAPEIIEHITKNVVGADVHPLAVIIARTNYLLAIRNLIQQRGSATILIPIYLCDTLRLPQVVPDVTAAVPEYYVDATENIQFRFPETLVEDPQMLDLFMDRIGAAGKEYERVIEQYPPFKAKNFRPSIESGFESSMRARVGNLNTMDVFVGDLRKLLDLVELDANSIWSFILKNKYKPFALSKQRFDMVLGNPPWLTMRQMKDNAYQDFLKEKTKSLGLVDANSSHLISLIELASLFFVVSMKQYLKEKEGLIAFVMPKGVMVGSQHKGFRDQLWNRILTFLDLEEVSPLFNISSCVVFASTGPRKKELETIRVSGELPRRNLGLSDAMNFLTFEPEEYIPPESIVRNEASFYHPLFHLGASIQPRRFWCVKFQQHDMLGLSLDEPAITSDTELDTKPPWSDVVFTGSTESRFLFATVTGNDLVPFGVLRYRPLLLPVLVKGSKFSVTKRDKLEQLGFTRVSAYLENAEIKWQELAQTKSKDMTVYDRLDYMKGISAQSPTAKYKVIYGASGTNLTACVINQRNGFDVEGFHVQYFMADKKTYFCDLDDENEALYLSTFLNSNVMNDLIKPLQSRGLWGARDIHKRPLLFPIPKFDAGSGNHAELAKIGQGAHQIIKLEQAKLSKYGLSHARQLAKELVTQQIAKADNLVKEILAEQNSKNELIHS